MSKTRQQPPSQQQIEEWIENPITIWMKAWAEFELNDINGAKSLDAFHPFNAERTQEVFASLNGCAETWELVIAALEGEGAMEIGHEYDEQ
jgi:hypothetical protein